MQGFNACYQYHTYDYGDYIDSIKRVIMVLKVTLGCQFLIQQSCQNVLNGVQILYRLCVTVADIVH